MYLFSSDSRLSEIIFHNPAAITVLNRFGLRLGVGAETVAEAAARIGIDPAFLTVIINVCLNEDYFPEQALKGLGPDHITAYLLRSDAYYTAVQLPNISRHLDLLISRSGARDGNLRLLRRFFDDMADALGACARAETERGDWLDADWQPVADSISDLLSFFVIHLRGDYDENLAHAVVNALFTLEKDLRQTLRLRERLLRPMLRHSSR